MIGHLKAPGRMVVLGAMILELSACSVNRMYTGEDEATVNITGFVVSFDGRRFEKRSGAHVVSPGTHIVDIGMGWPDLSSKYYALKVDAGQSYRIVPYRLTTLDGAEVERGWRFSQKGSSSAPTYKSCGTKPVGACQEDEREHECVLRECLADGWD